jgi:predicted enzyme related to lactoylglutathione lyase
MNRKIMVGVGAGFALALASPAAAADGPPYGLFGVKIPVQDFQRTINFYSALGLKPGPKHNPQRWELQWDGPARGAGIMMMLDESGSANTARVHASLMIHVPDVNAVAARLRTTGHAGVGEPRVTPRATILIVRDPDGNEVELLGPGAK